MLARSDAPHFLELIHSHRSTDLRSCADNYKSTRHLASGAVTWLGEDVT